LPRPIAKLLESIPSLRYTWLTYRRDQLWFPAAFWSLFAFLVVVLTQPLARFNLARAYLGFVLPLIGGLLAAYAVLDDPAIELRFATPVRPEQTLALRIGLVLAMEIFCALAFELLAHALGIDLSALGSVTQLQLAWFLPTLALTALGTAGAFAGAQTMVGAVLVGGVWLVQVAMKSWFVENAKPCFVFLGVFSPRDPGLFVNRCSLFAGSLALFALAWRLLRNQERFLGSERR